MTSSVPVQSRVQPDYPDAERVTTRDVAEILGVSTTRVAQLVRGGRLPAEKQGGHWYFRRHQVAVMANARQARKLGDRIE